jgi:RHS repeat-associated protein
MVGEDDELSHEGGESEFFGFAATLQWEGYSPWGNRFLFTGREWLSDNGASAPHNLKLYDFRNRVYQPELGRFMSPDPKQFAAGDYNLYRYCHNDPVNNVDPTGLQTSGTDEILNKPNLTMFGAGDWMRQGSPFTNGEMLGKAKNYVLELRSIVKSYVDKANEKSCNVTWSADFSNSLRPSTDFSKSAMVATTVLSTQSAAVTNANGTIRNFYVNLQIDIKWNDGQSRYFGNALRPAGANWLGKTGEIEHARDGLRALSHTYGGALPARDIANQEAASMIGRSIPAEDAAERMDGALAPWVRSTTAQSKIDHDDSLEHMY